MVSAAAYKCQPDFKSRKSALKAIAADARLPYYPNAADKSGGLTFQ